MQIALADGEAFDVQQVQGDGASEVILGIWEGRDREGQLVRFIRYREKPDQLYFTRHPNRRYGGFAKGQYVTGFTVRDA